MRRQLMIMATLLTCAAAPEPALRQVDATGVLGRSVRDADGREIGRIVDVVVEPSGQPEAVVVDTGGFMGVGARRVAVAWAAVHVPSPAGADQVVSIDLTDEQVRAAPIYSDRTKPAMVVGPPAAAAPEAPGTMPAVDTGKAAVP